VPDRDRREGRIPRAGPFPVSRRLPNCGQHSSGSAFVGAKRQSGRSTSTADVVSIAVVGPINYSGGLGKVLGEPTMCSSTHPTDPAFRGRIAPVFRGTPGTMGEQSGAPKLDQVPEPSIRARPEPKQLSLAPRQARRVRCGETMLTPPPETRTQRSGRSESLRPNWHRISS
jgi:hypothetical protein